MRRRGVLIGNAALRPVLVICGFGYLLVDIFVTLMGRMPPPFREQPQPVRPVAAPPSR